MGSGSRIGRSRGYHSYYRDSRFARAGCVGYCATSFVPFGIFLLFAGGGLMVWSSFYDKIEAEFEKKSNENSNSFFGNSFQNTKHEDREDENKESTSTWTWNTKKIIAIILLALGAILLTIGIILCIYVCKTVPKQTTPSPNMISGTVYQSNMAYNTHPGVQAIPYGNPQGQFQTNQYSNLHPQAHAMPY